MTAAKILVLSANRFGRWLFDRPLLNAGYEVILLESGVKGLVRAVTERPDLIVLDLPLADMEGPAFLKYLRGTPGVGATPTLVTASEKALLREAQAAGANYGLFYPFPPWELVGAIRKILRNQSDSLDDIIDMALDEFIAPGERS